MKLTKGNSITFEIPILGQDGLNITNLSTVTEIYFMFKTNLTDDDVNAVLTKKFTDGDILVDTPTEGILTINLTSIDTDLTPGKYYILLQIEYSNLNKQEINLRKDSGIVQQIEIVQDGIRG